MSNYKQQINVIKEKKIYDLLKELPTCYKFYVDGRMGSLSPGTLLSYTYKFRAFVEYLHTFNEYFMGKDIKSLELKDFATLTYKDIISFKTYVRNHINEYVDSKKGLTTAMNKINATTDTYLAALSSFWDFYVRTGEIELNPVKCLYRTPKKRTKIITLNDKEQDKFLNAVETGKGLTERQLQYHAKNQLRDLAICNLLLDTGIRVSELVGIDINDINLEEHSIYVDRKGGNNDKVYMSDYCETFITDYLAIRNGYKPQDDEYALFLNRDGKRIGIRSIEKIVVKYRNVSLPNKADKITVHKLRSTYATKRLENGVNLAVISKSLGHTNFSSTQRYTSVSDEMCSKIRNF